MRLSVQMAYGLFVFGLSTLAYENLRRSTQYRHAAGNVVGGRPKLQFIGPGAETINLTGRLFPQFKGTPLGLDLLRSMAAEGKAWPLICGYGRVFGTYVVTDIDEAQSNFTNLGIPERIEFTVNFTRADVRVTEALGTLKDGAKKLLGMA